jgi:hypothetical protein
MKSRMRGVWTVLMLAAAVAVWAGPAVAQEAEMTEEEVDELILQFLPEGVTLEEATDEQLDAAVFQAVSLNPGAAGLVVARAVQVRGDKAGLIVFAAVRALPEKRDEITAAARETAPPEMLDEIEAASQASFVYASRAAGAETTAESGFTYTYVEWTPISTRQDAPASPVAP